MLDSGHRDRDAPSEESCSARPSTSVASTQAPSTLRMQSRRTKPRRAQLLLQCRLYGWARSAFLGRVLDNREEKKRAEAAANRWERPLTGSPRTNVPNSRAMPRHARPNRLVPG